MQPELGKELAKIRNANGLTQDELAERSNISKRTIQRIESGAVNPRLFTIKTLSAILDHDFFEQGIGFSSNRIWFINILWLLKDLFNLKTNTMKKLTILSIIACAVCFGLFVIIHSSDAQNSKIIDYSKFMKPSNQRGTLFLFPKGERLFVSNVKDTADYELMGDLIQEYKKNIYLNGKYMGRVLPSDTVIYNFGDIVITSSYWTVKSSYGQNIYYMIPKGTPIDDWAVHIDTEFLYIGKHIIKEYGYNIFLDDELQGKAEPGDTVVFKDGMIEILE